MYMYEFEQDGAFLQELSPIKSGSASGLAVDGAGDLYYVGLTDAVEEVSSSGQSVGRASESHSPDPSGVAVNPAASGTSDVFADLGSSVEHYGLCCGVQETFGSEEPGGGELKGGAGVAFDASPEADPTSGTVYVADVGKDRIDAFAVSLVVDTGAASEVGIETMKLSGTVNPKGSPVTGCEFQYATEAEYAATKTYVHSKECEHPDAAEIGSGSSPVEVHADLEGLQHGTVYHYRLLATNAVNGSFAGENGVEATPPTPRLAGEEAPLKDLTRSSAELTATVDPEGYPVIACIFEYGTSTEYEHSVPCAQSETQIGEGKEPVPVSAQLTELKPNTEYHWRLVAENNYGKSVGPDHTFVYKTEGGELPDHRAYEMVTPPFKNGAFIGAHIEGINPGVAEDGSRVTAPTTQCFASSQSCTALRGNTTGETFEFNRTSTGWEPVALAPPATQFPTGHQVLAVDPNTGMAIYGMTPPFGEEDGLYLRQPSGAFLHVGPESFPEGGATGYGSVGVYVSADFSHLVLYLTPGAPVWPFDRSSPLYEYVGTGNVEPFAVGVTGGPPGSEPELIRGCDAQLGDSHDADYEYIQNALSADGRTVYFTCNGDELYARVDGESEDAHTVAISQPKAPQVASEASRGYESPPDEECTGACEEDISVADANTDWRDAEFMAASQDGSHAVFLDTQKLTDQATQGAGNVGGLGEGCSEGGDCNLYLYDFDVPAGHNLIDVSAGDTSGAAAGAGREAVSEDGSHVYSSPTVCSRPARNPATAPTTILARSRAGATCMCMSVTTGTRRGISRSSCRPGVRGMKEWGGQPGSERDSRRAFLVFGAW